MLYPKTTLALLNATRVRVKIGLDVHIAALEQQTHRADWSILLAGHKKLTSLLLHFFKDGYSIQ